MSEVDLQLGAAAQPPERLAAIAVIDARRQPAQPGGLEIAGFLTALCRNSKAPTRQCLSVPALTRRIGTAARGATEMVAGAASGGELGWDLELERGWALAQRAAHVIVLIDVHVELLASTADRLERHSNRIACELRDLPHLPREKVAIVMVTPDPTPNLSAIISAARARLRAYEWWGTIGCHAGHSMRADDVLLARLGCIESRPIALDRVPLRTRLKQFVGTFERRRLQPRQTRS